MVVNIKNKTRRTLVGEGRVRFESVQVISWASAIAARHFARMRCAENKVFEAVMLFGGEVFRGSCRFLVCPNSSASSRFKATGGVTSHPPDRSYAPVAFKYTWILVFQEQHLKARFRTGQPFPISINREFTGD